MATATEAPPVVTEPVDSVTEDYFGFEESHTWKFPDEKQYIVFTAMDEGRKSQFQKSTNRDLTIKRQSGDASMRMDPAEERHQLILQSATDWFIFKGGNQLGFSRTNLTNWLSVANPKLVQDLELAIRKANPWLQQEMSVEEIDKEMDNLRDMRAEAVKRDEGKGDSSNK